MSFGQGPHKLRKNTMSGIDNNDVQRRRSVRKNQQQANKQVNVPPEVLLMLHVCQIKEVNLYWLR